MAGRTAQFSDVLVAPEGVNAARITLEVKGPGKGSVLWEKVSMQETAAPGPAAIFALKGAEIILAPTWGTTFPDRDGMVDGETTFRVRARDNGVYMVPSAYDGSSLVIDPMGRILASNAGRSGVFWAEVDLSKRECLDWVGYWRSIGPRDRMPETYDSLVGIRLNPEDK